MEKNIDLRANGKLLIAGEYLVLAGAKALAIPLKFGQHMKVKGIPDPVIRWTSHEPGSTWFTCDLDPVDFKVHGTDNPVIASRLSSLLKNAQRLNPSFHEEMNGISVDIEANYPVGWGLGSSSTLISLIAQWAAIDSFSLIRKISDGSGYDIACADRTELIFYQLDGNKHAITETTAGKALRDYCWFAGLGNKQDSGKEVYSFLQKMSFSSGDLNRISELSELICHAVEFDDLYRLVNEHEKIIGQILKREPVALRFKGFPGTVKSLGAWGGDFAMFVSEEEPGIVREKLKHYGLKDIFLLDEIKAIS